MSLKSEAKNRLANVSEGEAETGRLSPNALRVLENRYLKKDERGLVVETPREMFERVARHVASVEDDADRWSEAFFDMMWRLEFMPNSPTLMNAGRPLGMLSACFVLPLEDSIPDIMETARQIALVQRAGGGTGVDLSKLRPRGSIVRSSGGTTEGPLSFLKMLSGVTDAIQQGAFRRGANMGTMRVDHPDILDFVRLKEDLTQVTNYNLSVTVPDGYMELVRTRPDEIHVVVNPHDGRRALLRREDGRPDYDAYGTDLTAEERGRFYTVGDIFDLVVEKAWLSGEPGLIFIDRVNEHNPTPNVGEMTTTNPCGEQPLLPYEACNLGSLNLARFVRADRTIDYDALARTVRTAVRFLDDVVEVNRYPTPEIDRMCRANRKIGLGVMGWADLLFRCGIGYDTDEALDLARKVGGFIQTAAWDADTELAEEKGCFEHWKGSVWDVRHHRKMRNAHCVTIAPTGTISIIAGCSGGIEPIFSLAFERNVLGGERLFEVNPIFEEALADLGLSEERRRRVIEQVAADGTVAGVEEVPQELRRVFRSARDVTPEAHVRMQAAWQEHTDAAVSKTINFPHDAPVDQVKRAYLLAYELGCKGITVYRDGSRRNQPMALKNGDKQAAGGTVRETSDRDEDKIQIAPVRLPEIMSGLRIRQITPFGNMHVKISVEAKTGREREVFAQLGKGGDVATSDLEAICRLISLFLRCNGPIELALKQLEGIGSSLSVPTAEGRVTSLADGLAKAISKYLKAKHLFGIEKLLLGDVDLTKLDEDTESHHAGNGHGHGTQEVYKLKCPECAYVISYEEGCLKCYSCGYSQC